MIVFLLVIGVLTLCYLYSGRVMNYWKNKGVITASNRHWFFGHFKPILLTQKHVGIVFQDIYNQYPEEPYVGYLKLFTPGLAIRDPDLVKAILSNEFTHFNQNEIKIDKKNDFLMGNNPFVLHGQEWKTVRGHVTPMVTFVRLKQFLPEASNVCSNMVQYVKRICAENGTAELELKKFSGKYTTDVVANAVLGVTNNSFTEKKSVFEELNDEIFAADFINNLKVFTSMIIPKISNFIGLRFTSKRLQKGLLELTRSRMEEPSGQGRSDIFQQLKAFRDNDKTGYFTDEYIASHCFTFMADGYETSSDLMCFMLYQLAWHSEIQDRLRGEIMDMITETNGDYGLDHIEQLKYMDMVVSETLRLYPPATVLGKVCTEDFKVPNTSLVIKKGTAVSIPIYGLHMDEKYYPKVNKFDPERFSDEAVADRHKFVYLPFGEGPRKCLGQRFALFQIKLAIIELIRSFRLKPSAKTNYPVEIDPTFFVTRPLNGAYVHFENINK